MKVLLRDYTLAEIRDAGLSTAIEKLKQTGFKRMENLLINKQHSL